MLNKEFKRKDVESMRNLIKGNVNDSAELQVGYKTKKEDHKEGDIWEEGGKKWTIKDSIKQTYTKLDDIKKQAIMPIFCPECNSIMKKRNDTTMYKKHQKCFDCVVKMEHKMRIDGTYNDYELNMMLDNAEGMVNDYEAFLLDKINTSNTQYVSERGEIERWKGGVKDKEKLESEIKHQVTEFKKQIKKRRND